MDNSTAKPSQSSGCVSLIVCFVLLFGFYNLLGRATKSELANTIIVLTATLGAVVIVTFGYVVAAAAFKLYRSYRSSYRSPVSPQWMLLRIEDLPPEIAAAISDTASTLAPLGFRLIGCVSLTTMDMEIFQGLLQNQRAGTVYRCVLRMRDSNVEKLISIQTRYSDGNDCVVSFTSSRTFASVTRAPTKGRSGPVFFDIEDPARLVRLQTAAADRNPSGRLDTGSLDPIHFCMETGQEEMTTQVEAGYLKPLGDEYRATRIGALKMAVKAVWPVSALRIKLARRRAARFLAETAL